MLALLSLALSLSSANVDSTLLQFPDSTYSPIDARDLDDYCADQVGELGEAADSLDVARCHEYDPTTYPLPAVSGRPLIAPASVTLVTIRPARQEIAPRFETTCSISCPD
jgi:hypothetical protein